MFATVLGRSPKGLKVGLIVETTYFSIHFEFGVRAMLERSDKGANRRVPLEPGAGVARPTTGHMPLTYEKWFWFEPLSFGSIVLGGLGLLLGLGRSRRGVAVGLRGSD